MVGVSESFDVYSVKDSAFSSSEGVVPDSASIMKRLHKMNAALGMLDNQADNLMGYRVIVPKESLDYRQGTLEEYHVRLIINGVPEGIDDFIAGTDLPLELRPSRSSLARLPYMRSPLSQALPGQEGGRDPNCIFFVCSACRASGKTGSNVGNTGLALVKLDLVADGSMFEMMDREGATVRAKAFFPAW
ncbi:hypothetical protein BGZ67_006429 [Mortierella alpina]|nr:hypothetical protein BGZ67_006429 [Mortierella alpina]